MFKVKFFLQILVLLLLFGCGSENSDEHSRLLREYHISSGEVAYASEVDIVLLSLEHFIKTQIVALNKKLSLKLKWTEKYFLNTLNQNQKDIMLFR